MGQTVTAVISLHQPTVVYDPNGNSNNASAAVQIQNQSAYVLDCLASGWRYTLQPYTAQTIPLSGGQSLQMTPIQDVSGQDQPATIYTVWLMPLSTGPESPPMTDGPLTSTAIAQLVQILDTLSVETSSAVSGDSVPAGVTILLPYSAAGYLLTSAFLALAASAANGQLFIDGDPSAQIIALFPGQALATTFPEPLYVSQLAINNATIGGGGVSGGAAYRIP